MSTTRRGRPLLMSSFVLSTFATSRLQRLASYYAGLMTHWIAFDEESTSAVAAQTQAAVLFRRGDALDLALSSTAPSIVVMPSSQPGELLLLHMNRNDVVGASPDPICYEATGFLGLQDEPVFADEPVEKKKWWQRILD